MTPFDTALRIHRREVDSVKVSISIEVERITTLEAQSRANAQREREERALAATLPVASDGWTARMKHEQVRIREAAHLAQARLGQLRAQAIEAYGTMRAIEGAAERYQDEADRTAAATEQTGIDDIAAARFLLARRMPAKRTA